MKNSPHNHKVRPVFVGGTGRSGTTVMGDLLGFHEDIRTSVPIEIKFLANKSGLLQLVFGRDTPSNQPKISIFNLRAQRIRRISEKAKFAKIQVEFLDRIWNSWWDIDAPPPHGRGLQSGISKERFEFLINRLISNLTPLNIAQARRILKLFPDALFINMVRDPRDVIASLLTKNWGPTTPLEGLEWIEKRLCDAHEALGHIPANQKITIALEDLAINNRLQSYQALLKFLNLGDDAGMKEFFETHLSAEAAMSGRWKDEIATPEFLAGYAELEKRLALLT